MQIAIILFGLFLMLAILGVPLGTAIGLASIIVLVKQEVPLVVMATRMYSGTNSFSLMAIPFFMLAGGIMEKSGLTQRLVNFANSIIGWLRCGLCYVTIMAGVFLGGISGSAPADTAALGSVLIPSMEKQGYPKAFSASLMASAGSIGIIIPPSIPMVILAGICSISLNKMFMGGLIPGILCGIFLMIAARIICGKNNYGTSDCTPFSLKNVWKSFKDAILALMAPIIIIGGILTGYFTATESGVVVVIYTLFLGIFIYKSIGKDDIKDICVDAIKNTANVMLVVASSTVFSWLLTSNNFHVALSNAINSVSSSAFFVLTVTNIVFFIGGCFLDGTSLILMFCPVFYPIITAAGVDPVVFGVMIVINLAIGNITPPVGNTLFVASTTAGIPLEKAARHTPLFILAYIIVLILVCVFPALITYIPSIMS